MVTKRTKNGDEERHEEATATNASTSSGDMDRRRTEAGGDQPGYLERRGRFLSLGGPDDEYDELDGLLTAAAVGGVAAAIEGELLPGILVGAGAVLLGRMFPQIGGIARPVVKAAIRAGYSVADSARYVISETGEQFRDIAAEVQSERRGRRSPPEREDASPRVGTSDEPPESAVSPA